MNVIKRSGEEVGYNGEKIIKAVSKANQEVRERYRLTDLQIRVIEDNVRRKLEDSDHAAGIEEIQNMVITEIMKQQAYDLARVYSEYRYKHALKRRKNTTDDSILALIEAENEELKQENSNKNPMIASTQRDYIAGEVSKDLSNRVLLPADVVEAHKNGIIHFHDSDYFLMHIHNCCLINLEDMLQNGTVITDTMITKPNSFASAANIATQIIAQVASNQYGLTPFACRTVAKVA